MSAHRPFIVSAFAWCAIALSPVALAQVPPDWKPLLGACEKSDLAACNELLDKQSAYGSYQLFALMSRGKIYFNKQLF